MPWSARKSWAEKKGVKRRNKGSRNRPKYTCGKKKRVELINSDIDK